MLQINELFNSKPNAEAAAYTMEEPAITGTYQTYRIEADGVKYQVMFNNVPNIGKKVQVIRVGQVSPDQKKFKPLVKKINKPLEFFGALRYILNKHCFEQKYTSTKQGFIFVLQKSAFSIKADLAEKIAAKIIRPTFQIVADVPTPTAALLGGLNLTDGEFSVITIRRNGMAVESLFNGDDGKTYLHGATLSNAIDAVLGVPATYWAAHLSQAQYGDIQTWLVSHVGANPEVEALFKGLPKDVQQKLVDDSHATTPAVKATTTPAPVAAAPVVKVKKMTKAELAALPASPEHPKALTATQIKECRNIFTGLALKTAQFVSGSNAAKKGDLAGVEAAIKELTAMGSYAGSLKTLLAVRNRMIGKDYGYTPIMAELQAIKAAAAPGTSTPGAPASGPMALTPEEIATAISGLSNPTNDFTASAMFAAKTGDMVKMDNTMTKLLGHHKSLPNTKAILVALRAAMIAKMKGQPIGAKPAVVSDGKQWFFSPARHSMVSTSSNIGYVLNGDYFTADSTALTKPSAPFGYYFFSSMEEASKFKIWFVSQSWKDHFLKAVGIKVDKMKISTWNDEIPGMVNCAKLADEFSTILSGNDKSADWLIKNFDEAFKLKTEGLQGIKISQVYKWFMSETFENGVANTYVAPAPAAGTSAAATSAAKVAELKKPKAGLANGLRAKDLSPATIAWLSANPPATAMGKGAVAWPSYKNGFQALDEATVEVNGFELKFSAATPTKLFKQLNGFKSMVGASSAEMATMKAKLNEGFGSGKDTAALTKLQSANFPASDSISAYTGSSYGTINAALRGSEASSGAKTYIKSIDKYMAEHGKPLPANVVVYRGQSVLASEVVGLIKGNEYVMHGYVSTSTCLSVANSFMGAGLNMDTSWFLSESSKETTIKGESDFTDLTEKFKCMLVITGLDKCLSVAPGNWGLHKGECEVIINRGTRLKIDPTIPVRKFSSYSNHFMLIYCTISGDGAIDYGVNEMTNQERELMNSGNEKKFSEQHAKRKLKDGVDKLLVIDNFVKGDEQKVQMNDGDQRWTDDVFG